MYIYIYIYTYTMYISLPTKAAEVASRSQRTALKARRSLNLIE